MIGEKLISRTRKEREVAEDFNQQYALVETDVMLAIERDACGSDFGGSSWTTKAEADRVCTLLKLAPGIRLLDIGSGAGWPGIYLSRRSGCDVVLSDVPLAGLQRAVQRANSEQLSGVLLTAAASGDALPFRSGSFEAISHSDVLCCLPNKRAVLEACRRVIRPNGRMVFSVISAAPGLSETRQAVALENGPPFIETNSPYTELLEQSGWLVNDCFDITGEFVKTVSRVVSAQKSHETDLRKLLGDTETDTRLRRMKERLDARKSGVHRREIYVASPAP